MSLDISPLIPTGRQVIQSYKGGVFRVSQTDYVGPIFVFPDRTLRWAAPTFAELTFPDFAPILDTAGAVQVLLLGCGETMRLPPLSLRNQFKGSGIVVEAMDTGAACRTFNVLMSEDRKVAAALLPTG